MGCYLEPRTPDGARAPLGEWLEREGVRIGRSDEGVNPLAPALEEARRRDLVLVAYLTSPPAAWPVAGVMFSRRELERWRGPRSDGDERARPRTWYLVPLEVARAACEHLDEWLEEGRKEAAYLPPPEL